MSCQPYFNKKGMINMKALSTMQIYKSYYFVYCVLKNKVNMSSFNIIKKYVLDNQYALERIKVLMSGNGLFSIKMKNSYVVYNSVIYKKLAYLLAYIIYNITKYNIKKPFSEVRYIGRKLQTKNKCDIRGYFINRYINHDISSTLKSKISKHMKQIKVNNISYKKEYETKYNLIQKIDKFKEFDIKYNNMIKKADKLISTIYNSNNFKQFIKSHPIKPFTFDPYKYIKGTSFDTVSFKKKIKEIESVKNMNI